jgi:hypothetical protein
MSKKKTYIPSSLDRVAPKAKVEKRKIERMKRKKKPWKFMFMLVDMMTRTKLEIQ